MITELQIEPGKPYRLPNYHYVQRGADVGVTSSSVLWPEIKRHVRPPPLLQETASSPKSLKSGTILKSFSKLKSHDPPEPQTLRV